MRSLSPGNFRTQLGEIVAGRAGKAAYPYHVQFSKPEPKFWFYNSMHFPEPMSASTW